MHAVDVKFVCSDPLFNQFDVAVEVLAEGVANAVVNRASGIGWNVRIKSLVGCELVFDQSLLIQRVMSVIKRSLLHVGRVSYEHNKELADDPLSSDTARELFEFGLVESDVIEALHVSGDEDSYFL